MNSKFPVIGKNYHGLLYQRQPTAYTCTQTCIAMLLGWPVSKVIIDIGGDPLYQRDVQSGLTRYAVPWNQFIHGEILCPGWFMLSVASLTKPGLGHAILVYFNRDLRPLVLDPSKGSRYYMDGSNLKYWTEPILTLPVRKTE